MCDSRRVDSEALIISLRAAVAATPRDLILRMHLADVLQAHGRRDEAVQEAAAVLQQDPANASALRLISGTNPPGAPTESTDGDETDEILQKLDDELSDVIPPKFATAAANDADEEPAQDAYDVERVTLTLDDVGGMAHVKERLEASVLAPIRNPELGRLYGKSARGGLLLYGPPGCGKTYIARALAGELGATFLAVSLADVLDMFVGQSERNLREIFDIARRNAPAVLFLDEIDALGHKRSQMRNSAARGTVNQLLTEMDGIASANEGVFVLGATNHPWDVDVALRRPGRFDRMLLVMPPDAEARESILRQHLKDRPIANIDVKVLAGRTEGYSGADLAYICNAAAERALLDSSRTGTVRMLEMADLETALGEIQPSVGPWFETARNVVEFANGDGTYDELALYLKQRRKAR